MELAGTTATGLYVRDFPKMMAFYRDTLGLPMAAEEASDAGFVSGETWAAFDPEGRGGLNANIHFFELWAESVRPSLPARAAPAVLSIGVADLDATVHELQGKGVAFLGPVVESWGRYIRILDPEGNEVELHQWDSSDTVARWEGQPNAGAGADPLVLVKRLFDSFNDRDAEAAAETFAPGAVWELQGNRYVGPDGWRRSFQESLAEYPDALVKITKMAVASVAAHDVVTVEYVSLLSPGVEISTCDIWECKDGQILGGRTYVAS
jgi:catechol 2,3-dioxygenase-like lactoylglutathione lyase family enzyme